jgi:hypothetical protein
MVTLNNANIPSAVRLLTIAMEKTVILMTSLFFCQSYEALLKRRTNHYKNCVGSIIVQRVLKIYTLT